MHPKGQPRAQTCRHRFMAGGWRWERGGGDCDVCKTSRLTKCRAGVPDLPIMNFRTTIFLLAMLLVAGTLALVIHYRQNQQPAETKDERKLVDLEEKDLAKVVVTPAGGK